MNGALGINIPHGRASIYISTQRVVVSETGQAHFASSARNYATNEEPKTVQLIIHAPSSVFVTSLSDAK